MSAVATVSSNTKPAQPAQKKELNKTSSFLRNYVSLPASVASTISGTTSFLLPNVFKIESELIDTISDYVAKAAVFANSVYAGYDNWINNNTVGFVGYAGDLISSIIAPAEDLYIYRGIGTCLDQGPGMLKELKTQIDRGNYKSLKDRFNPEDKKDYVFSSYPTLWDNAKKTFFGTLEVIKNIFSGFILDFKKESLGKALKTTFLDKAENNLLISGLGALTGALSYIFLGFKKFGSTMRDMFGLYCDFAVLHKGIQDKKENLNQEVNKEDQGDGAYRWSGTLFTAGTVLDLLYRWLPIKNLHLQAMGIDRLGSFFMAEGNVNDNAEDAIKAPSGESTTIKKTSPIGAKSTVIV